MKRPLMNRIVWLAAFLLVLPSCLKEGDTTVLLNDPQEIPFITDYLPEDLWRMFGEENVHFGDQPPVVEMEFKSMHQFVSVSTSVPNHPQPGECSPVTHYHKICQQYLQIANYLSMSSEEASCKVISPVYLMGYGNDFTMYFYEKPQTEGSPEHAVLLSGTLTNAGVKNFRYGYKILRYNDSIVPSTVYPANSIFIFKDVDGLAEACNWYSDSLINPSKTMKP